MEKSSFPIEAGAYSEQDLAELVVNDATRVVVKLTIPRRGAPMATVELDARAHAGLLRWLLAELGAGQDDAVVEPDESILAQAIALGLVIPTRFRAAPVAPLRCVLDSELLALIPDDVRARRLASRVPPSELEVAPGCTVQTTAEMPAGLDADWPRSAHAPAELTVVDGARPIVWLRAPGTRALTPLWCTGEHEGALRGVFLDGAPIASLDRPAIEALRIAGVLWPKGAFAAEEAHWERTLVALRADLARQRYAVLRGVLSPLMLAAARQRYRRLREDGWFCTDETQVVGRRDGVYCDLLALFLQRQLEGAINAVTPERVKGSYAWVYRYRPGAVLRRHTDRPQCRWNVSLALDQEGVTCLDEAWPLALDVDGAAQAVALLDGDAVLYSGTDTPHWRDALAAGQHATMCFLHYVPETFAGSLG